MTQPFKFVKPHVAIINAPSSFGQPRKGVETGPLQLVKAGLADQIEQLGLKVDAVEDHEGFAEVENDIPIGKLKNPRSVSNSTREVYEEVSKHAKMDKIPVTLGGDHSLVSNE